MDCGQGHYMTSIICQNDGEAPKSTTPVYKHPRHSLTDLSQGGTFIVAESLESFISKIT